MTFTRRASLLAVAFLAGAGSAHAQGRIWNVCGGNTFNTCASVALSVQGQNVTVNIWNLSGFGGTSAATLFSSIGFEGIGSSVGLASAPTPTMSGSVRPGDTPEPWIIEQDRTAFGVELDLAGVAPWAASGTIASGCATTSQLPGSWADLWMNPCRAPSSPGTEGWVTITFSITGQWDVANTYLLVKGRNQEYGTATACITGGTYANCAEMNVVPEPITVILLGSGLAGMGGLGVLRRRKKDETQG